MEYYLVLTEKQVIKAPTELSETHVAETSVKNSLLSTTMEAQYHVLTILLISPSLKQLVVSFCASTALIIVVPM
jgi:hypothetical protein